MQQESFSEQESLKLINEMIGKAKKSYVTKGIASIAWGSLIIFCSLINWSQFRFGFDPGFDVWVLTLAAVVPQIYFSVRETKKRNYTTYNETASNYVWTAFGISIFILSFYNGKYGNGESTTLFMMLYAIPTFITGGIYQFKPMIIGGVICWTLSIVSIFTPVATDLLLMAACGLFAWLIPGIILWNRYQKHRRESV